MTGSQWTQDAYLKTMLFAAEAHGGQQVPGTEFPYLLHITLVCMEVIGALREEPADQDGMLAVQCALLHDVIEDTHKVYADVAEVFGEPTAAGVLALSKDKALAKEAQMADSLLRIQQQPQAVWMVKLADRITNLQPPPPNWDAKKIDRYRHEAGDILAALGSASPYLSARLQEKINLY